VTRNSEERIYDLVKPPRRPGVQVLHIGAHSQSSKVSTVYHHHGTHPNSASNKYFVQLVLHSHRLQQWTRLIRFIAAETSQVHYGQPVDPRLDGESQIHFIPYVTAFLV
jgi:hypothetical protein